VERPTGFVRLCWIFPGVSMMCCHSEVQVDMLRLASLYIVERLQKQTLETVKEELREALQKPQQVKDGPCGHKESE
jgi:hypothetical protein